MPSPIVLERSGAVATLRLSSPKAALTPAFFPEFEAALGSLAGARALILRGEQDFCAGLSIRAAAAELSAGTTFWELVGPMQQAVEALAALDIPTVAAVQGRCIGAGLELAAACDLRCCSAEATFALPEVRLGLVADLGGLQRLPELIGRGRAAHLALTGQPINAAQALDWGLVTAVPGSPAELYAYAGELAADLAALPAAALTGTKRTLRDNLPLAEGLQQAASFNAGLTAEAATRFL